MQNHAELKTTTRWGSPRVLMLTGLLLLACGLVLWQTISQHNATENEKLEFIQSSLDGTSQEIQRLLNIQQNNLNQILGKHTARMQFLLDNPLDQLEREEFTRELRKIIPSLQAVMLTDQRGNVILEDYLNVIDQDCKKVIRFYAREDNPPPLTLHNNRHGQHYSLLSRVRITRANEVIVLAQLEPSTIHSMLHSNKPGEYAITLLDKNNNLRLSSRTDDNHAAQEHPLPESGDDNIRYRVDIPGTQWELLALQKGNELFTPTWIAALWTFCLLLLLGSVALWLLRRSDAQMHEQSDVLARQQRRLNNLQQTTIASQLNFHEKIRALLVMGLNEFDMDVAILSRVEARNYKIIAAVSPDNNLQPGMHFTLNNTYCRHTLSAAKPTCFEQTSLLMGKDHPSYNRQPIGSYLGTPVYVRGRIYGTLNFSSTRSFSERFTQEDLRFLQLMSQWIGLEIERRESEQQLQTQNQLLESISRAQSYFISDQSQSLVMFDQILSDLLSLSFSNAGFIAEVLYDDDNQLCLRSCAIAQRYDSGDDLLDYLEKQLNDPQPGKRENLLAEVIRSGAPVISNNPVSDSEDEPSPVSTFLGVPLYHATQMVGIIGLVNSPDDYQESFLYTLAPLATTSANLIWALRNEKQRIHTERALRESEEQLTMALEGANDGVWDWNIKSDTTYYSPRWQTMLGYEPGEIKPRFESKEKLVHPDDLAMVKEKLQEHLQDRSPIYQSEHRVKTKSGDWIWILDRAKVVERDNDGNPLRAVGTHTDITERKQAEEAVRERETRIAAILDTAVDGIITINDQGVIESFNPAAEKIFGYSATNILGSNVSILMGDEDRELHNTYIKRYLTTQRPKILGRRREVTGVRANGSEFPMQLAVSEMIFGGRRHFTGIIRDITQTREAERLLQESMAFKQGILDSAKLSIISTDANGIIQTFNASAQQMLGFSERELIGRFTPELFHDRAEITQRAIQLSDELGQYVRPGFEVFVAKARIGIADEQQWTYIAKDGRRFPVLLTMTALHDNNDNILGFVAIARDISRQKQAEEEISRFKTTLDMTLDCVFMFSPETLRFFYVNQGAIEQVGYNYGEMIRMRPIDLLTEYNEESFRAILEPMIQGKRNAITVESWHRHSNGTLIPVEVFLQYIYPVDQEPRFVAIVRDITERRRAAESLANAEERARLLLESAGEGIYGLDLDGRTTFVNPATARMLGYEQLDLIGQYMHEIILHSYADRQLYPYEFSPTYKAISEGDIQRVSNEVMWRKDGTSFPVEYTVTPLRKDDEITGAVVIFNDITERKKVELIKNEFISTVSHELRTPLTSVRGSLGLLVGGAGGGLPEQARTLVEIANKNTERLLLLINDILDIEKIESGKIVYNYKILDLQEFLDTAIQANFAYGQQFGINFTVPQCPRDISIYADEDRLMQVMNNLLSNAAKFSNNGGEVEVSAVRRGHKIRISVTDNGQGIPQSFQKKVFEKFAQADASDTRAKSGTGLGLSISRAIIEQHGGRIDFVSRVNMGTTFFFDLPVWTQSQTNDAPQLINPTRYRILICEDDADIAYMLRMILAQAGFDTDIARNVEQAKQQIKDNHYLAVTLDLALPDEQGQPFDPEGIRLIRELRKQDRTRELPVIVVSAIADQAQRRLNGSAFGIIDWLEKPLDEGRLLSAVRTIASHKQGLPRILHVEDDPIIYEMVRVLLRGQVDLVLAPNIAEAHRKLNEDVFDLILLDVELTDGSGLDLIRDLDEVEYMPQVVIFSANEVGNDVAQKVKAALVKSSDSRTELINVIMSVIKERETDELQQLN